MIIEKNDNTSIKLNVDDIKRVVFVSEDDHNPVPQTIKRDADNAVVQLNFNKNITRGEGAVTAKYYKEWDIMNPVEIPREKINILVTLNSVMFAAPTAPAGAIVCFSYEANAFKDSMGNPCGALNSGLNMNTGKFTGAYVQKTHKPFEVTDDMIISPTDGADVTRVEDFKGIVKFPFAVYRHDETVADGDLSVTYTGTNHSVTHKLSATDWSVNGDKISFVLPAAPAGGDKITFSMVEGAVTDVLGNPNAAFESSLSWQFFVPTVDMILGTFEVVFVSYWSEDGSAESMGSITIKQDPKVENAVIIKNLFVKNSEIKGTYDLSTAKLYIPDWQVLGIYTNSKGTKYGMMFVTADGSDAAAFTINSDGTLTADSMWGLYALDENFQEEIGWLEVAKVSQLVPVMSEDARKSVRKAARRNLKRHVQKE